MAGAQPLETGRNVAVDTTEAKAKLLELSQLASRVQAQLRGIPPVGQTRGPALSKLGHVSAAAASAAKQKTLPAGDAAIMALGRRHPIAGISGVLTSQDTPESWSKFVNGNAGEMAAKLADPNRNYSARGALAQANNIANQPRIDPNRRAGIFDDAGFKLTANGVKGPFGLSLTEAGLAWKFQRLLGPAAAVFGAYKVLELAHGASTSGQRKVFEAMRDSKSFEEIVSSGVMAAAEGVGKAASGVWNSVGNFFLPLGTTINQGLAGQAALGVSLLLGESAEQTGARALKAQEEAEYGAESFAAFAGIRTERRDAVTDAIAKARQAAIEKAKQLADAMLGDGFPGRRDKIEKDVEKDLFSALRTSLYNEDSKYVWNHLTKEEMAGEAGVRVKERR